MSVHPLDLLESLGIRLERDPDTNRLVYSQDAPITSENVRWALNTHRSELARLYDIRERSRRRVCAGGPLDGKRHSWFTYTTSRPYHAVRVKRAKWAVYQLASDGLEARFVGYATSEPKAKRGEFVRVMEPS